MNTANANVDAAHIYAVVPVVNHVIKQNISSQCLPPGNLVS